MKDNKLRILITGATGSIGNHLIPALIAKGYNCRCLVRPSSDISQLKESKVELVYADISTPETLKGIADGIDVVYHLAAEGHVTSSSNGAYERFWKVNVEGTKNLIEECKRGGVKRFIHFSSTAAMGLIEDVIADENTPCVPTTPYQKAKFQGEQVVLDYWKREGFCGLVLRPCMVYGEECKGEYLKIFRLMKKGVFPRLGNGRKLTPVIYIANLIHAAVTAAEKGQPGKVYLLVDESVEIDVLREKVLQNLGIRRMYPYISPGLAVFLAGCYEGLARFLRVEPGITAKNIKSTIADRVFNTTRAQKEVDFRPIVRLDEGLQKTIFWAKTAGYL